MNNWKILIADGLADNGQSILHDAAQLDDRTGISPAELLDIVGEYDALLERKELICQKKPQPWMSRTKSSHSVTKSPC